MNLPPEIAARLPLRADGAYVLDANGKTFAVADFYGDDATAIAAAIAAAMNAMGGNRAPADA